MNDPHGIDMEIYIHGKAEQENRTDAGTVSRMSDSVIKKISSH
jgi:hypothetical protein